MYIVASAIKMYEGGREGGRRERGKEGGREGRREGEREGGRGGGERERDTCTCKRGEWRMNERKKG